MKVYYWKNWVNHIFLGLLGSVIDNLMKIQVCMVEKIIKENGIKKNNQYLPRFKENTSSKPAPPAFFDACWAYQFRSLLKGLCGRDLPWYSWAPRALVDRGTKEQKEVTSKPDWPELAHRWSYRFISKVQTWPLTADKNHDWWALIEQPWMLSEF